MTPTAHDNEINMNSPSAMFNSTIASADFDALESTTLVTFFLQAVPATHSVELLGSWDNFTTPYPMAKDSRRGRGHWRGIHSFSNIICDGNPSLESTKRDGALRAGGLYWYYYRLNGDFEYHNPSEPSTTACPLLPGQRVNVLEVPFEMSTLSSPENQKLDLLDCMTLNPKDRWAPLKRKRAQKAAATPATRTADIRRNYYLDKFLGRQFTAAGEAAILTSSGYIPPLGGIDDQNRLRIRPKSTSDIFIHHKSFKSTFGNFSPSTVSSAASADRPNSRNGLVLDRSDSLYSCRPVQTRRRLQSSASFLHIKANKKFPLARPTPPSRSRTAIAALSTDALGVSASPDVFSGKSGKGLTIIRPKTSPTTLVRNIIGTVPNEASGSMKLEGRMKSLRLRVACAKLKTMQKELGTSPRAGAWDVNEIPKSFSEILKNYQTSDDDLRHQGPRKESSVADELWQSPPQLSLSSRESTIWTPETGSPIIRSQVWDESLRSSFRYSLQSALTVYDDDDDDEDVKTSRKPDGGNRGVLGVQFLSLGLGSQETIKPAQTIPVDPKPFDSEWNPFSKSVGVEKSSTQTNEEAHTADTGAELMSDLAFLGAAIA